MYKLLFFILYKFKSLFFLINKLFILISMLPISSIAQLGDSITFNQTQDINFAKKYKQNTEINVYKTKDGLVIRVGDTLTIGNASIERKKYLFNDVFSNIVVGNARKTTRKTLKHLPHKYNGRKVIVKSIYVRHERLKGFKFWANRLNSPLFVNIFVRNPKLNLGAKNSLEHRLSYSRKTIINIEEALSSGEIVNVNAPFSKKEAIKKLKESKDLMDLGFITNEEYEKIKEKLTPIILDKL